MRWFAFFSFLLPSIVPLLGNKAVEDYCRGFWIREREAPRWESSPVAEPLSFEELPLENTPENTKKIVEEIADWDVSHCLFALRFLVERDMRDLNLSWLAVFKEEAMSYRAYLEEGGETFDVLGVKDDFRGIVLFALYYVDVFRISLKDRLNALHDQEELNGNADAMLKLMVGRYWAVFMENEEVSPRSRTPMSMFGRYYF